MMVDKIRFTFDVSVQDMMPSEDIVRLTETLHSFIEFGIIDVEENEEIFIDQEYLQDLVNGVNHIRIANKKYGRDSNGLVKYPFLGASNGN
jgi:hypothetical protein